MFNRIAGGTMTAILLTGGAVPAQPGHYLQTAGLTPAMKDTDHARGGFDETGSGVATNTAAM